MKIDELKMLIENDKLLTDKINKYLQSGILRNQPVDRQEIQGHIEKSEHNLKFIFDNLKLGYFDWCITGCYYAVYQIALALILERGYTSKNHDATLCVLVKEYNQLGITKEDINLINYFYLNYQDLLFYINSKNKREEASYSTKYLFDKEIVEELRLKSIDFIDKARTILKNSSIFKS